MFLDERKQIPEANGQATHAPYFNFNDDKLKFDTNDVDNPNDNYGSASGFHRSPKSLLFLGKASAWRFFIFWRFVCFVR